MKRLLIVLMLLASSCYAKDYAKTKQDCGGWENWLQIVVTQEDQSKCISKSNVVTETCYHVFIQVHPGDPDQCIFQFDVPQNKVDNVVKDFMDEYLP